MSTPRKTIYVDYIKSEINSLLKNSMDSPDVRLGYIKVLSDILHYTGNFKGFRYLEKFEVPTGSLPGVATSGPIDISRRQYL